jgi:hypothetical protein
LEQFNIYQWKKDIKNMLPYTEVYKIIDYFQ